MDYRTILFWVSLAMALILLVAFFHQYFPKKQVLDRKIPA